jgi:hypothetical protein
MTGKHKDHHVVTNPECGLPRDVLAAMNARREAHLARSRAQAAVLKKLRPTEEEHRARQKVRAGLIAMAGLTPEDAGRITKARRTLLGEFREAAVITGPTPPPVPSSVPGEGELWWAQTYVTMTNASGMASFFQNDGLHVIGALRTSSENLWKGNLTVVAQFGVGTDRMPAGGTRFISNPVARFDGAVGGIILGVPFDWGDNWSKCWLNTSQNVYGGIPFPLHVPMFTGSDTRTLVFLEGHADLTDTRLPGLFAMPAVQILLVDRTNPIQIDLTFSLDFQLEGDNSDVYIGHPDSNESAHLQTRQWTLMPG